MGGNRTKAFINEARMQPSRQEATFTNTTPTLFYQHNLQTSLIYFLSTWIFAVEGLQGLNEIQTLRQLHQLHYESSHAVLFMLQWRSQRLSTKGQGWDTWPRFDLEITGYLQIIVTYWCLLVCGLMKIWIGGMKGSDVVESEGVADVHFTRGHDLIDRNDRTNLTWINPAHFKTPHFELLISLNVSKVIGLRRFYEIWEEDKLKSTLFKRFFQWALQTWIDGMQYVLIRERIKQVVDYESWY